MYIKLTYTKHISISFIKQIRIIHFDLDYSTLLFLISSLDNCAAFGIGEVKHFVGNCVFLNFAHHSNAHARYEYHCTCAPTPPPPTFHIGCTIEKFCVEDSMKSMKDEVEIKLSTNSNEGSISPTSSASS